MFAEEQISHQYSALEARIDFTESVVPGYPLL